MLYQNDGVYGAFNCIMFDHQVVHPKVLTLRRRYAYRPDLDAPGVESPEEEEDEEEEQAAGTSSMGTTVANIEELTQALSIKSQQKARATAHDDEVRAAAIAVSGKKVDDAHEEEEEGDALQLIPCSVWGPTCDSIDCVRDLAYLPRGLGVGDWLVYENMGAYTLCAASSFNGLRRSDVRYTIGAEGARRRRW